MPSATGLKLAGRASTDEQHVARDPQARLLYAQTALSYIPRLLSAIDRNPYRPTYGCMDRQFWHYRTSSFASEMYQEGVLPLALVHAHRLPGNLWQGDPLVRELAVAGLRFSARNSHRDGSCDDYYPYERALGAAVFSLAAGAEAYRLLDLDDDQLLKFFDRRAHWLATHDESGRLANHQAMAALALLRLAQLTGNSAYESAAERCARTVLSWQSPEGWFDEYGGADPGYQTVTIDALAKYRALTGAAWLEQPLREAVQFARWFLHPDGSYGGEYGSRGTYHFYPHGFELLAGDNPAAADLADGFLATLSDGTAAAIDDDRMFAHRLGNLIESYVDRTPRRPLSEDREPSVRRKFFPGAGLLVQSSPNAYTVVSAARGGVFKHFGAGCTPVTDAGIVVEFTDGRVAVSQTHDLDRVVSEQDASDTAIDAPMNVLAPLDFVRFETASPVKQALFHAAMVLVGRHCRDLIRRLLQRRLITGRRPFGVRLTRTFQFLGLAQHCWDATPRAKSLRVTDRIEIDDPRLTVRRMSFGTDLQCAYVAASGVYHLTARLPWTDLSGYVAELNARRHVTIEREI